MATYVRPFAESDIPHVAALHSSVFRPGDAGVRAETYRRYFSDVYLAPAQVRAGVTSLVYEREGRIVGFLGVASRRMVFRGKPIAMAVCSQFVVDPAARGQVGLRLLKECFSGPQDLTISDEAGDRTRTIWQWCGGEMVLPYSLRWIRPVRPMQMALAILARRSRFPLVARALAPDVRFADALLAALRTRGLRLRPPRGTREPLDEAAYPSALRALTEHCLLRPDHDAGSAAWALARAGCRPGYSPARTLLVNGEAGEPIGLLVYSIGDNGIAELLQLAAPPDAVADVLDHLLDDAMQHGAVAVAGRLEHALADAIAGVRAFVYRGEHCTLLHSADTELRLAVHGGDACLSRLEGEWCFRFP